MSRRGGLALALAAVLVAVAVLVYSRYTLDDSYIGYRFADNIAAGKGFVYNAGEQELGTTTPLFILVLALCRRLGADAAAASHVLGVCSFAGIVVLSWRLALLLGVRPALAYALGAATCVYPPLVRDAISGMETAPYACATLLVLGFALERRWRAFVVAGAVLGLLRPDGMLALVACGLFDLAAGGRFRDWVVRALQVVALSLPWYLFSWWYFGRLLPNSGFAKLLQADDWGYFGPLFLAEIRALAPIVLLIALGVVHGKLHDRRAWLPAAFVVVYVGFFVATRFPGCGWYLGPLHAPLLLLAALGAETLLAAFGEAKAWAWGVLGVIALLQASRFPEDVRQIKKDQVWMEEHHGRVGRWLAENTAPDAVVAADNIGYIGYFSGRRIIDITGLIQARIREGIARTGNKRYALETTVPEYIAVQNRGSSPKYTPPPEWFEAHGYRAVFTAPYGPTAAYRVWSRLGR